jgi:hypothetical protein
VSDDVCGYPTAKGTPCQHPTTDDGDADRCYIDAHNEADTESGDPGRDWSIDEADHDDILEAAELGASKAGCARAAGVEKSVLHRYLNAHDEFRNAFARARARGEQRLLRGPLIGDDAGPDMDGQHARFILSTSFEYAKTERKELTGEDGGPVEVERDLSDDDKEMLAELFDRDVQNS